MFVQAFFCFSKAQNLVSGNLGFVAANEEKEEKVFVLFKAHRFC